MYLIIVMFMGNTIKLRRETQKSNQSVALLNLLNQLPNGLYGIIHLLKNVLFHDVAWIVSNTILKKNR